MKYCLFRKPEGRIAGKARESGFSLVEIALVLVIVGLALGGLASALGPQLEVRKVNETQERMKKASDAILAFAMVNRRLPCPASAASLGQEQWCTNALGFCGLVITSPAAAPAHGRCANPNNGFVPARLLGLGEQGPDGRVQDAWSASLRYAVAQVPYNGTANYDALGCALGGPTTCYPLTQAGGLRNAYYDNATAPRVLENPPPSNPLPTPASPSLDALAALRVCISSTGTTLTTCGPAANQLATAAFLVWSTARNGAQAGGWGADEAENMDADVVYVSHPRSEVGAPNGIFDDIFQWHTTNDVVNSMSRGGALP